MKIVQDDLSGDAITALIHEHVTDLAGHSPAENCHAMPLEALRAPDVTLWSVWEGDALAGCGALRTLDETHGEIKSMRTASTHLRRGVAAKLLDHIIREARARGFKRLSLETGPQDIFAPSRSLYARFGFETCPPFGTYLESPYSVFMTKTLEDQDGNAPSKSNCRQAS
ncbi:GNAT family N-acetyltransferase [Kushneria sp. AK178]